MTTVKLRLRYLAPLQRCAKNGRRIRFKFPTEEQARDTTDSRAQCVRMRNIKIQHAKSDNNYDKEEVTSGNASSKRKRRVCDDIETPTCEVCGKTFPSLKAKYGHMRCHSNRPPRRMSGTSAHLPSPDPVSAERGLNRTETDDDIPAAMTLVYMSTDYSPSTGSSHKDKTTFFQDFLQFEAQMEDAYEPEKQHQNIDELEFLVDGNIKTRKNSNGQISSGGRYQCRTCKKCFSFHQALGGHTANHNKNKRELKKSW